MREDDPVPAAGVVGVELVGGGAVLFVYENGGADFEGGEEERGQSGGGVDREGHGGGENEGAGRGEEGGCEGGGWGGRWGHRCGGKGRGTGLGRLMLL